MLNSKGLQRVMVLHSPCNWYSPRCVHWPQGSNTKKRVLIPVTTKVENIGPQDLAETFWIDFSSWLKTRLCHGHHVSSNPSLHLQFAVALGRLVPLSKRVGAARRAD